MTQPQTQTQPHFSVRLTIKGSEYTLGRLLDTPQVLTLTKLDQEGFRRNRYLLDLASPRCDCPDFEKHEGHKACKHLRALFGLSKLLLSALQSPTDPEEANDRALPELPPTETEPRSGPGEPEGAGEVPAEHPVAPGGTFPFMDP